MPLTPAIRPFSASSSTAARPISAPPAADAMGVKAVAVIGNLRGARYLDISAGNRRVNSRLTLPLNFEQGVCGFLQLSRLCSRHQREEDGRPKATTSARRARGYADVAEIVDLTMVQRASRRDATHSRAAATSPVPLADIGADAWRNLAARAIEPNGYYLPDWEMAVNESARGRIGASALCAWDNAAQLTGLMPVISMWRAWKIPLPVLVSADPYGTLCTPLLDRDTAENAALQIMQQARQAGAHALILRAVTLNGAAMKAFREELRRDGMRPRLLQSHLRASLDARQDADELLRDALGAKKLKELRRQRNRLTELGAIGFHVARTPNEVAAAAEIFLGLEASGWKSQRGTALLQDVGDAAFVRRAAVELAETGNCEIVTLRAGELYVGIRG